MLVLFIAACFVAAGAGAVFTCSSVSNWYPTLRKPSWNPPAWIFRPVWTVLDRMMAIAAWLVWRSHGFHDGAGALIDYRLRLHSISPALAIGDYRLGTAVPVRR